MIFPLSKYENFPLGFVRVLSYELCFYISAVHTDPITGCITGYHLIFLCTDPKDYFEFVSSPYRCIVLLSRGSDNLTI